jgi:hypothetical protein
MCISHDLEFTNTHPEIVVLPVPLAAEFLPNIRSETSIDAYNQVLRQISVGEVKALVSPTDDRDLSLVS